MKTLFASIVLACALAMPCFAGVVDTPGYVPPPPPPFTASVPEPTAFESPAVEADLFSAIRDFLTIEFLL